MGCSQRRSEDALRETDVPGRGLDLDDVGQGHHQGGVGPAFAKGIDGDGQGNGEIAHDRTVDQGDGIASKDLEKIFEPFYTTNHNGTGLGLYIVNQLCELNDADISVASNEKGGTSFIITK